MPGRLLDQMSLISKAVRRCVGEKPLLHENGSEASDDGHVLYRRHLSSLAGQGLAKRNCGPHLYQFSLDAKNLLRVITRSICSRTPYASLCEFCRLRDASLIVKTRREGKVLSFIKARRASRSWYDSQSTATDGTLGIMAARCSKTVYAPSNGKLWA